MCTLKSDVAVTTQTYDATLPFEAHVELLVNTFVRNEFPFRVTEIAGDCRSMMESNDSLT